MHGNGPPRWMQVVIGVLIAVGGFTILRGVMTFIETEGTMVTAPTFTAVAQVILNRTGSPRGPTLDFTNVSKVALTPTRVCQMFKVKVVKARIRDCPKETCETLSLPPQGASICVYGTAANAPDWYEINTDPADPFYRPAYMHQSVLAPENPTPKPLKLATVTPAPVKPTVPSPTSIPTAGKVPVPPG